MRSERTCGLAGTVFQLLVNVWHILCTSQHISTDNKYIIIGSKLCQVEVISSLDQINNIINQSLDCRVDLILDPRLSSHNISSKV